MTYKHIEVSPKPHAFGAEIRGADLKTGPGVDVMAEIRAAWLSHQVVSFPDQELSMAELEAFTEKVGPHGFTDFIKPVDDHPYVLELRREPDEKATHFGQAWHSDCSYQREPPSASILLSKEIPPVGGDTLYSDGYRAYEALSDKMKEILNDLRGVHSAIGPYSIGGFYASEGEKRTLEVQPNERAEDREIHPLIRTHPETGRKSIFSNIVYTIGIEGMHNDEARAIIRFLNDHTTKEEFIYRHKWQPNMLTMWDNRTVQHYADSGFDGHRRVMWRTTVAGDRPV